MIKKHTETDKKDIDEYEDEILKDFEDGKFSSVQNLDEEMQLARTAASNFVKRDNRVNLRISTADLNMVRKIAVEEGIPYQTLMASIIHKFVSGRLIEIPKTRGK
jgi:predicted DNA binding CopG/RHH family protein